MRFEKWFESYAPTAPESLDDCALAAFQAGAASRDAEIEELLAALKPFGAIDLVESRLPAEFAMLILRARAAIAKVRKP